MSVKIDLIESMGIVEIIYSGEVSLDERIAVVQKVCQEYAHLGSLKALVNVIDLKMQLSLKEQQMFGEFLASHPLLFNAKVAVLHQVDYNPNLLIDTHAFNNGYRLAEFINTKDAHTWLCED